MNSDDILAMIRPLVLVVDSAATISDVRGGFGGFLGYDTADLPGRSVFDFVVDREVDQLATYFLESAEVAHDAAALPMPFNVTLRDDEGVEHSVDVIPTRLEDRDGDAGWVVLVLPIALDTSVSRSLDAEMAGAKRPTVRKMLTEELLNDNEQYSSRWFLVDLDASASPAVTTSRDQDRPVAEAIEAQIESGWAPWEMIGPAECRSVDLATMPAPLVAVAHSRGWRRTIVAPVHVEGALMAAYVMFGRVPESLPVDDVNANVRTRITKLVDVTALLLTRWRDRDRLESAAKRDPLTGLANRDSFADAMGRSGTESTLLYIDVDHFKAVNDRHGHGVGDRVLVEIANRIVSACRPEDVVARFGGDEFVVLLDGVDREAAASIGRRIVEDVRAPMAGLDAESVSVSVGLSPVDTSMDDVVNRADRAMLQAKRDGRSRVVEAD